MSTIDVSSKEGLLGTPPRNPLAILLDTLSACAAAEALVQARNAPHVSLRTRLDQHRLREDKVERLVPAARESSRSFMRRGVFMNFNRFSPDIIGEYGTMLPYSSAPSDDNDEVLADNAFAMAEFRANAWSIAHLVATAASRCSFLNSCLACTMECCTALIFATTLLRCLSLKCFVVVAAVTGESASNDDSCKGLCSTSVKPTD